MNPTSSQEMLTIRRVVERDTGKLVEKRHQEDALRVGESVSLGMALKSLCHNRKHDSHILDYVAGMSGPAIGNFVSFFRRRNSIFDFMLRGPGLVNTARVCLGQSRRDRERHNAFAVAVCLTGREVFQPGDFYDRWLFAAQGYADGQQYKAVTNHLGKCAAQLMGEILRITGTRKFDAAKVQLVEVPNIREVVVRIVRKCFPTVHQDQEAAILSAPSPTQLPNFSWIRGMVVAPAAEPSQIRLSGSNTVTLTGFPGCSVLITPAMGRRARITVHGVPEEMREDNLFYVSSPAVVGSVSDWANLITRNPPTSLLAINGTLPSVISYAGSASGSIVEDEEDKVVNQLRRVMADAQVQALLDARATLHAVRTMVRNMEAEYAAKRGRAAEVWSDDVRQRGRRQQRMTQEVLVEAMLRNAPKVAAGVLREAQARHATRREYNPVTGTRTGAHDISVLERAAGSALQWIAAAPAPAPAPAAAAATPTPEASMAAAHAVTTSAPSEAELLCRYLDMLKQGSLKHYAASTGAERHSYWDEADTADERREREFRSRRKWLGARKEEWQWIEDTAPHLWAKCMEIETTQMEQVSGCGSSPWDAVDDGAAGLSNSNMAVVAGTPGTTRADSSSGTSSSVISDVEPGDSTPAVEADRLSEGVGRRISEFFAARQWVGPPPRGIRSSAVSGTTRNARTPPASSCVSSHHEQGVGASAVMRPDTPPPKRNVMQRARLTTSNEEVAGTGVQWRPAGDSDSDMSPLREVYVSGGEEFLSDAEAGTEPGHVFLPQLTEVLNQVHAGEPSTPPYSDGEDEVQCAGRSKRPVHTIPELEKMMGRESVFDEKQCEEILKDVVCTTSPDAMGWRGGGKKCVGWQHEEVAIYGCARCISVALRSVQQRLDQHRIWDLDFVDDDDEEQTTEELLGLFGVNTDAGKIPRALGVREAMNEVVKGLQHYGMRLRRWEETSATQTTHLTAWITLSVRRLVHLLNLQLQHLQGVEVQADEMVNSTKKMEVWRKKMARLVMLDDHEHDRARSHREASALVSSDSGRDTGEEEGHLHSDEDEHDAAGSAGSQEQADGAMRGTKRRRRQ